MSNLGSRRGQNVSQYLRELNSLPTAHDSSAADEAFAMEDDLALFTNTQFFDFDSGQNTDYNAPPPKHDVSESRAGDDVTSSDSVMEDFSSLDFVSSDFGLAEYGSAYTSPTIQNFAGALGELQSIQPGPQSVYQALLPQHQTAGFPGAIHRQAQPNDKRSPDSTSPGRPVHLEEVSRVAAEEDKRRRNTAASARFRVKKKQREQALEKSAKEMTEKVTLLENRITQLETENKWLKNLIMEKNEGNEEMVKLWKDIGKESTSTPSDKKKAAIKAGKE